MAFSLNFDNSKNPNAPEFGKPWKREHNGSCFCAGCEPPKGKCLTYVSRSTRIISNIIVFDPCVAACNNSCLSPSCSQPTALGEIKPIC